ncbi:MAG: hypothetical protein A2043_09800 [Candidatus Schekmanbacteria bacterium GWA2_38_9]|uniref:Cytochrome c domain-containing protein n=1 Tax=Candidatus Schekmanbacteria bacterium RIFCSPLOWO2_12_FULL_38_15 TaxID=1817883 RepID=A0A1F7SGE3_9BACT|nr:MAG: hypothetical protein A2043_09800 [Candidatus Schekmanbacteria bacterium GWA2_38_9]OGL49917.1 MAG: hypothetical protein A3H37_09945 [Candidatus Schekmanbacteria bacterium RIFCSPLOWO2_02_FULL_38_14]OGL52237.1 MAG: hypothetical protein A3G31_02995 [Candidatus Schekmanbacteria bacterium RIFCSPLOWO2_12_FULL_38_15]
MIKNCRILAFFLKLLIFLSILLFLSLGCEISKDKNEAKGNNPNFALMAKKKGKAIFLKYCSPCHGEKGDGNGRYVATELSPKPRNFTEKRYMEKLSNKYLFESISKGPAFFGKSNLCPPWENTFNEEEIKNIIYFIRGLSNAK